MKWLRKYDTPQTHASLENHPDPNFLPMVCATEEGNDVYYHKKGHIEVDVQYLLDNGYATRTPGRVINGNNNAYWVNAIQISSACPYSMGQITDFVDVLTNTKRLGDSSNTFTWSEPLPNGWTLEDITDVYAENPINTRPLGHIFCKQDFSNIDDFYIEFTGRGDWASFDYPWGSFWPHSLFSDKPQYGQVTHYGHSPKNVYVKLSFDGDPITATTYTSVLNCAFTNLRHTEVLTIEATRGLWAHDAAGAFEQCYNMHTLNFFATKPGFYIRWDGFLNCTNMFHACQSLKEIPMNSGLSRDHQYNTVYPHWDGNDRGSNRLGQMFSKCYDLETIWPTVNLNNINLTLETEGKGIECPSLTNARFKNINNCDWDFSDINGLAYAPLLDADSVIYAIDNVVDVHETTAYTLTFGVAALTDYTVSGDEYIPTTNDPIYSHLAGAVAKGWDVKFKVPTNS